jgi:hypothetical protein
MYKEMRGFEEVFIWKRGVVLGRIHLKINQVFLTSVRHKQR